MKVIHHKKLTIEKKKIFIENNPSKFSFTGSHPLCVESNHGTQRLVY